MTREDILTLAKAGFTANQIAALNNVGTQPAPAPAAPAPAAPAPAEDPLTQILGALQVNAINATQQPAVQTTDDILAEIINPK